MQKQITYQENISSRLLITICTVILVPFLLIGCAWLAQHPTFDIIGVFLALLIICIAWALSGAGPGTFVSISAFAFLLFIGPALHDLSMEKSGVQYSATLVNIAHENNKKGADWNCTVVTTNGKPIRYTMTEATGCWENLKEGQKINVVVDPSGWLRPMLATDLDGSASQQVWISVGIGLVMEVFILYGRLRRRKTTAITQ